MKLIELKHLKNYHVKLVFDNEGEKVIKETNCENLMNGKSISLELLDSANLELESGNLHFSNGVVVDSNTIYKSISLKKPEQEVAYFHNTLISYKNFIKFTERHWTEELEKYKDSNWNRRYDRYGEHDGHLFSLISTNYPQYQRQAHLVMLLSLFEDFLKQFCSSVQERLNSAKTLKKFKRQLQKDLNRTSDNTKSQKNDKQSSKNNDENLSEMSKIEKYLSEHIKLHFPFDSNENWLNIKNAQKIRNEVVHLAGHIAKKDTLEIVKADKLLDFEDYARTHLNILDSDYLFGLIEDMQSFTGELRDSFEMHINN